jgi:hypothetical protein
MAQMCLNCGERPALPKNGKTVPLCSVCAPKAGSPRGVNMSAPKKPKLKLVVGGRA